MSRLPLPWLAAIAVALLSIAASMRIQPGVSPGTVASGEVRVEPGAVAAPRTDAPPEPGCAEELSTVERALGRPDGELSDDGVLQACTAAQIASAQSQTCAARVRSALASAGTCARAFGAVATCSASSAFASPDWTREMLRTSSQPCRLRLVSSLHQARVVDAPLIEQVRSMADDETVPGRRARLWLALGSLERTAREGSSSARLAAATLDVRIAQRLHAARGYERIYMLEAAGNAACSGCTDDVRAAIASSDPTVRRAGVAAMRFRDDAEALAALCTALEDEPIEPVRELAAWSLRWSASSEITRAACLERAATSDLDDNVRTTAAQSLFALANRSPAAAAALARVTGEEDPHAVAWLSELRAEDLQPFDPLHALEDAP